MSSLTAFRNVLLRGRKKIRKRYFTYLAVEELRVPSPISVHGVITFPEEIPVAKGAAAEGPHVFRTSPVFEIECSKCLYDLNLEVWLSNFMTFLSSTRDKTKKHKSLAFCEPPGKFRENCAEIWPIKNY